MKFTRARIAAASLLLVLAGGGAFVYFRYQNIASYVVGQISAQAEKKLGRQVRFSSASFSPLRGIVIKDACVSRLPDFSKGEFFCAERTVIRPRLPDLLRNRVHFSRVAFSKPVFKVREKDGRWDFEDLLALLPETNKGLYLTWNADELRMRGASLEADMETSGLSLALGNADLRLAHYSSHGGNYNLEAVGLVQTVHGGKLVSARADLDTDLNFDYGGLASASGSLSLEDLHYGTVSLENFRADWKLFNIRKPLRERNYSVAAQGSALLLPPGGAVSRGVSDAMALLGRIAGKPLPAVEEVKVDSFGAGFALDNSRLVLKDVSLKANFLTLGAGLAIDGPAKTADASFRADFGKGKLEISADGPIGDPELKPLLSATLAAKVKEALRAVENQLLKIFPVTGEKHV